MARRGCFKMPLAMAGLMALVCMVLIGEPRGVRASDFCRKVIQPLGYACTEFTVQTDDGFVLAMHRLSRVNWPTRTGDDLINSAETTDIKGTANATRQGSLNGHGNSSVQPPASSTHNVASVQPPPSPSAEVQPSPIPANHSASAPHYINPANVSDTEPSTPSPSGSPASVPTPLISSNSSRARSSKNNSSEQPLASAPSASPTKDAPANSAPSRGTTANVTSDISHSNFTARPWAGKGAPVLLMHQEFLNGDSWFQNVDIQLPNRLLPTMLFDDGFDVWIGHQRATYWGHDHVLLHSTERAYWNWTWDEHAHYDLPAQLRFISAETSQTVHYIGASQAATVGAAAATNPEIARMLRSLTLIGPTAYRGNSNSLLLDAWAYYFGLTLDSEYYATGFQNGAFNYSLEFPPAPITGEGLSGLAIGLISGPNCCLGSAVISLNNGWDGTTSFKNLLHWQQGIRRNSFAHYDYGDALLNTAAYGQATPPPYDPAQISARLPILMIAGANDWTAPSQGIDTFMSQLQEPAQLVNLTNYAHYDLTFSATRERDIYVPILDFLEGPGFD